MTQDEILDALEDERENFLDAIDGLSDDALLEPDVTGDWSIKDILFHICMWEAELVKLLWQAAQSLPPSTVFFSGLSVDEINASWTVESQARTYDQVWDDFQAVRKQTVRRLSAFNDKDLNNPERYTWLKGNPMITDQPLWFWIAESSFAHEKEHAAQIKEWRLKKGL
jgi:uncharacterized damage-inducible protein DinB